MYVSYISTKEAKASKDSRIFSANQIKVWPKRDQASHAERTQASRCLNILMLSRRNRLSSHEVDELIKKGKSFFTPLFLFRIAKNNLETARFSVVVPKKVEKTAVGRNRNKRRVVAILEKYTDKIAPYNFFCQVKQNLEKISSKELEKTIHDFLVSNRFLM